MTLKRRLVTIYCVLAAMTVGSWAWALEAFHGSASLLGMALMMYGMGLRHAVDADHIAAIDNVTRKLMQGQQRPVCVGFYFAIGHSAIVCLVAAAVAVTATMLGLFQSFRDMGGTISTTVSAVFLMALAVMNIVIFRSIYRTYKQVRAGGPYVEQDLEVLLTKRGVVSRLLRSLFGLVGKSWHMLLLGLLFGLGFDTATEITMFSVSASQASHGLPLVDILVFPCLFAAAMSTVDTTDGVLKLSAYEWAFIKPMRKLFYNMTITMVSVIVAALIGGIEALGLVKEQLMFKGPFWDTIGLFSRNLNKLGLLIIGIFLLAWAVSYGLYRWKGLDDIRVQA